MNKLLTKIAGLFLGMAMAIGVGIAVGSNADKASAAKAEDQTVTWSGKTALPGTATSVTGHSDITFETSSTNTYTDPLRVYANTTITIAALNGASIKSVTYTASSTGSYVTYAQQATVKPSVTPAVNGKNVTWSYEDGTTNFTFKPSSQTRCDGISVTYTPASTPVSSLTVSGTGVSNNALSIGSSDSAAHTINVAINSTATNKQINISHQGGTNGLFTLGELTDGHITCDNNGEGSFTLTGTNKTSGSETFRIASASTSTKYVDLVVTAFDDSVTHWTVSFDVDGGSATINDMSVEDGQTFTFPSPGTKAHYSFDGWTSDLEHFYQAGETSPAVDDDTEYLAFWTEDAKYTITYVPGDHGTGDNYVVNNVYGGSYTLATFSTAGFTAASGYVFTKWSVGGVEYAENTLVTISGDTTITAIYEEMTTYTIVTDASKLVEDTTFVLVYNTSSDYYISNNIDTHVVLTKTTSKTTISNGVASGSTLVSSEAMVLTLKGSSGAWKIKCGDKYLKFTGSSNGNDEFDVEANASTFSASIKDNKYILFTCTSTTGSGRVWRMNTGSKDMRNYATNSGVGDVYMFAYIPPQNELSSIALSGDYKTSFASGETFSFGGIVTANYTINNPANVTTSATFHLDSVDGANMSGVTMTNAAHNGHTIYVKYTEGDITKTATYDITVANAPVESLTIGSNTGKVATGELFDMSEISVEILPADAVQTYEWTVLSNTVNGDYTFEADIIEAGNTDGTITLKCTSTADSNKYQTFVLEVSGNPVVTLPSSVSLYTGKTTTVKANVEGGTSPYSYSWSITSGGSSASIESGGSTDTVTLRGTAAGSVTLQCSVTDSNKKPGSESVTFTVVASAVTSVSWSASSYNVFSGATIPADIDNTWMVNYEKNNGDGDYLIFGDYELYLGDDQIDELPYTFKAADDGKTLHVEYGGVSSSSVDVAVTQTINSVIMDSVSNTVSWTATAADNLGSQIDSQGGTATGTISTGDYSWNYTRTLTALASGKADYIAFQGSTWIQLGSSSSLESLEFTTSAIPGTIKSVSVVAATAGSHTLTIDVGGTKYLEDEALHLYTNNASATNPDPKDCVKTGIGSSSGAITISIAQTGSTKKAMVIRSISVTYEVESEEPTNLANVAGHEAAQRLVVAFAKAFNTAMDGTANCTTGLSDAWSTCSSAWTTFTTEAHKLGETEEEYALNLIKYATAQWTEDTDENYEYCLERAMATYERCVKAHGQTAFMSAVRSTSGSKYVAPISIISGENNEAILIIALISIITVTCAGGYFFLRRRKED